MIEESPSFNFLSLPTSTFPNINNISAKISPQMILYNQCVLATTTTSSFYITPSQSVLQSFPFQDNKMISHTANNVRQITQCSNFEVEDDPIRKCVSNMMQQKQKMSSTRKRRDILTQHRQSILEAAIDSLQQQQLENEYVTTAEFEYLIQQSIERLIQGYEEEDLKKIEQDEELRRAADEYYRNQLLQYEQDFQEQNNHIQ